MKKSARPTMRAKKPWTITSYDILGRPILVTAPDATTQSFAYLAGERQATDPRGNTTRTYLDAWGRTRQVIPPAGPSITYEYDYSGRLDIATYGGAVTSLEYDLAGRKLSMTDPDMGTWYYTYDALGNLKTQTDARNCVITLSYDLLNRLIGKTYSGASCGATTSVAYIYDGYSPGNGQYGIGRRTGMSDGSGSTS